MTAPITARQAETLGYIVLLTVDGRPATAGALARRMGISATRVRRHLLHLHQRGCLVGPSSPAVLVRGIVDPGYVRRCVR